jgi:hypothetical protein
VQVWNFFKPLLTSTLYFASLEVKMPKWNLPVDPEELQFALQLGNAAGTTQMPIENPETKQINIVDEESGEIQKISLKDNPINRFGGAIAQEFGKDESKFYSIMNRIAALMRLLSDDKRVQPYLKSDPADSEHTMINNVLIEVIAKFPISRNGDLDKDAFFAEVEKLVSNEI